MMAAPKSSKAAPAARANLVDRLVGYFSPTAGLVRQMAREQMTRAYSGASRKDGWSPMRANASANTDHAMDATELRSRARFLVQNVPYVTASINGLCDYTVGTGITPRSLAKTKPEAERIDALWAEWVKVADADGLGNFYTLQERAYRAMEVDGEVLVRLRPRRASDGLPVPLQLQVLEIDWLDSSKNGTLNGNAIVNGVEYDAVGKVAAYWLFDQHPGELVGTIRRGVSRAVPAGRIIHLYRPERPGQGRGFSRLAPVVTLIRDTYLYHDSELARKNLESRLSVIASGDLSQLQEQPEAGSAPESGSDLGQLASGGITAVPAGMNMTTIEPKAAPGYVEYISQNLHLVTAGIGVPYELATGDMSGVNFSSARIRRMDFKKAVDKTQWLLLVPQLCDRVWGEFMDAAVLARKLTQPSRAVDWSTPKWEYVNPIQDVAADVAEIAGGLSSFSEKLRQRNQVPELVFAELKTDLDRLQKDGTLPLLFAMKSGNSQAAFQANGDDEPAGNSGPK